jgi:hypothetical protein
MRWIFLLFFVFSFGASGAEVAVTCEDKRHCGGSLDDIAKKCQNPGSVNRQIPPSWIRVICKDMRWFWQEGSMAEFLLPGMGKGKVMVLTSKHDKASKKWKMDVPSAQFDCLNLEQVKAKRAMEMMMDCEDFLSIYETIESYCAEKLMEIPPEITTTGQVMTTCPQQKTQY